MMLRSVPSERSNTMRYCSPDDFTSRIFAVPPSFSQIVYTHCIRFVYEICSVAVCPQQAPVTVPRDNPGILRLSESSAFCVTTSRTISLYACGVLQDLSDQGLILYEGKNKWSFTTQKMDAFLPPLDTPDSSWGTNYIYWYWFEKRRPADYSF